jgi:hypothetical protein
MPFHRTHSGAAYYGKHSNDEFAIPRLPRRLVRADDGSASSIDRAYDASFTLEYGGIK